MLDLAGVYNAVGTKPYIGAWQTCARGASKAAVQHELRARTTCTIECFFS
jgi:hypothetical protein